MSSSSNSTLNSIGEELKYINTDDNIDVNKIKHNGNIDDQKNIGQEDADDNNENTNTNTLEHINNTNEKNYNDDVVSMYPDEEEYAGQLSKISTVKTREDVQNFEVQLLEEDPEFIANKMSVARKYYITFITCYTSIVITVLSSVWTFAAKIEKEKFGVTDEVATLGITLYIFGLGFGPLFLSPISEFYGRKITFIFSLFFTLVFIIVTTFSPTLAGIFIGRFFSGFFGSAFLSVAGGVISDIFNKKEIGIPITLYSLSPFAGPTLGPILSAAFIHNNEMKYAFITILACTVVSLGMVLFTLPETYKPYLCINKAKRIRKEKKDDRYFAPLEIIRKETKFVDSVILSSKRPLLLVLKDPMMATLCFYTGLELGIVYMFFVAFPIIYQEKVYHFTAIETACCYLGLLIGMFCTAPANYLIQNRYQKKIAENGGVPVPEYRLYSLYYGSVIAPAGLMIFAWTIYPHVPWIASVIGCGVFGAGVALIFSGVFGYTVDAYRLYAASAMASNSFVRSTMAGVLPLVARYMFDKMGVNWASFFLAIVCVLMIPIPFLFDKYGAYLRSKSPYAWDD